MSCSCSSKVIMLRIAVLDNQKWGLQVGRLGDWLSHLRCRLLHPTALVQRCKLQLARAGLVVGWLDGRAEVWQVACPTLLFSTCAPPPDSAVPAHAG